MIPVRIVGLKGAYGRIRYHILGENGVSIGQDNVGRVVDSDKVKVIE